MAFPISAFQGVASSTIQQALNADGTPAINVFDGTEPLYGVAWAGGSFESPVFTFTPTWNNGPLGFVVVPLAPENTLTVWPGSYTALVRLDDSSAALCSGQLIILPAPVSQVVPSQAPFTRALADQGLMKRVLAPSQKAKVILDGSSPVSQFDDPLARALAFMGILPTNPISPADADINLVYPNRWQELMDIAEAEFLVWLCGQLTMRVAFASEQRAPDFSFRLDPLGVQWLNKYMNDKLAKCLRVYGYGAGRVGSGTISLGFQALNSADENAQLPTDTPTVHWDLP